MRTLALTLIAAVAMASVASAEKVLVNKDKKGLALQGYDPVAYFTDSKPVKGDAKFTATYKGATYRFASEEHKRLFEANPAKYEPQFGGFCGYAASINKVSPISVDYWEILDGRLVLQHNQKAWDLWHKDVAANLKTADANWPGLVEKNGK
jgi:YHS domain-containing protein